MARKKKKNHITLFKKDGCTIFDGTLFLRPVHLSQAAHIFKHHHFYIYIKNILNNTVASKRTSEHDVNMAALNTGPHVFLFCFVLKNGKKTNTLWLQLVGATTATSRKAWAMANKKKGTTVGGYVLVNSCKCHLTSHTTVNTSMIVQLAYHRLYNRPASPLSCLCSSSCSSPLLNKKTNLALLIHFKMGHEEY